MGAYLSEPNLNKESLDDGNDTLTYGASSMQGWRLEQEDAHNSIIDFDTRTSFFAVYDGHGGQEVAAYCAKYLPQFLKTLDEYKTNNIEEALKQLFLKFDESLLGEEVLKELAQIRDPDNEDEEESIHSEVEDKSQSVESKSDTGAENGSISDSEATEQKSSGKSESTAAADGDNIASETAALYDEACMPLEDVLKRYSNTEKKMKKVLDKNKRKDLKNANTAHLSPMISAAGSSKRTLKAQDVTPPAKSAAELDKQEEIDITEIKKNGHGELNGSSEANCELDFDEASNLCDLTDSQKDGEASVETKSELKSEELPSVQEDTITSNKVNAEADSTNQLNPLPQNGIDTPSAKQRHKLRQEEIKLSPIRNKSMSSSSLCDDSSYTQKNETMTSDVTEPCDTNSAEAENSSDAANGNKSANGENKENDFNNSGNEEKTKTNQNEEVSTTAKPKKQSKKDDKNLIAKLIAGVINERLRSGSRSSKAKNTPTVADKHEVDDDDDDEFDANYEESDEEDGSEEDTEEETGSEEDGEDEDESSDDDYDVNDEDEELEDEESYPNAGGAPRPGFDSGCTAVLALLREDKLYVANAGDSRCVVCRDGKAVEMSFDHKPEDDLERQRVEKAGGEVTKDGRINNGLNLSRAIGDHTYKRNTSLALSEQMITALPDVMTLDIDRTKDKFMVLACDGIWNFMSSQDVCDYIQERIDANYTKLSQICEELFMHCLAPNSEGDGTGCDNMTCILVTFQPFRKFELKVNKNGLLNEEAVETDKNSLKRTLENGSTINGEVNLTKKIKQEDEIVTS